MRNFAKTSYKKYLLAGATVLAMGAAPMVAHATPYAFAGNQITNLLITNSGNAISGATGNETIYANAQYNSTAGITQQNYSPTIDTALALPTQAYQGPSSSVGDSFSPDGAGSFTGTRGNAAIGAKSGSGSSVMNVAEGYGNANGNSQAYNTAAIYFKFTPTTSGTLDVTGSDLYQLIANTAGTGENAKATISDYLTVNGSDGSAGNYNLFTSGQPSVNSFGGLGNQNIKNTAAISYTTFALNSGVTYTLALQSTASEVIVPGTPVPEPGSLVLLGTGLLGLALVSRKRVRKG